MNIADLTCGSCGKTLGSDAFLIGVGTGEEETGFEGQGGRFVKYPLGKETVPALVTKSDFLQKREGIDFFFTVCDPQHGGNCSEKLKATLRAQGFIIVDATSDRILFEEIPLRVYVRLD